MIKVRAKTKFDTRKVIAAAKRGNITSLAHAGAAIRLAARHSIRKNKKPAAPGRAPNTRRGRLRNAIRYAVEKAAQSVLIGPDAEVAGTSGAAHEFGGRYREENYPRRAFMGPALAKTQDRLPAFWAASVKG